MFTFQNLNFYQNPSILPKMLYAVLEMWCFTGKKGLWIKRTKPENLFRLYFILV